MFRVAARQQKKGAGRFPVLATLRYLGQPEAQTFAFSVAANAILSFFPFMIVLITMVRRVFESPAMYSALVQVLREYIPSGQEALIQNLNALASPHRPAQISSLILLLITAKGVFMPLEVALNHIWGFERSRGWLHNQLVGTILAFVCGLLALFSIAMTAGNQYLLVQVLGRRDMVFRWGMFLIMKLFAIIASVVIFLLIYRVLPNGKIFTRQVLPAAIVCGLLWELLKHVYIGALPRLRFHETYGIFTLPVTMIFWAYLSGLLLLGGAFVSARRS
ncbi:MAG: YihY/virulence factor BrkB family protein [Acidobacteriales bacterium]|nr:YihY/virulence factor BrkB family protein [Terriglobales bacterium]